MLPQGQLSKGVRVYGNSLYYLGNLTVKPRIIKTKKFKYKMLGVGGKRVKTNKNANNGLSLESGIIGDGDFLPSILVNSPHTLQQTDITLRT